MSRDGKLLFTFVFVLLFVTACATMPKTGGVYHSVKKGETLWRIARAYNCDPNEIARANNLPDTTIEAGSALFIPDAKEAISITPDTPPGPETPKKDIPHTLREETLGPIPTDKPPVSTVTPGGNAPAPSQESSRPSFMWPVEGPVSSKFGTYKGMRHNGIKIDGKEGAPVLAAASGTVTYAAPMKYFGETVIVKHNDTYSTVYSQLKERMVSAGNTVKGGDRIGLLGKGESGKSHLYFEIRSKNRAIDPMLYLPQKNKDKQ
ncbi:MAG: M23 family metallopeptidase [Syntrophales bacterium]|nr:M23 family metallopeptidase [Syntrophales bacterium]